MGKTIRIEGFEFKLSKNLLTRDLYTFLKAHLVGDFNVGKNNKYHLFAEIRENYFIGLILSYKNNKTFLESNIDSQGNLIVQLHELKENESGIEPSIFIINPTVNKGIMMRHQGAINSYHFERILRSTNNAIISEYTKQAIEDALAEDSSLTIRAQNKLRKKITNYYKGNFEFNILASKQSIDSALALYNKLESITSNVTQDIGTKTPMFSPISGDLKRLSCTALFDKTKNLTKRTKSDILKVFNLTNFESLKGIRLIGEAHNAEKLLTIVGENRNYYDKIDYDEFAKMLPHDLWKNFDKSESMDYLLRIIQSNTTVFGNIPTDNWYK